MWVKPNRLPAAPAASGAATKPGNSGAERAPFDEAERGVAERRGDREHRQRARAARARAPAVGLEPLHVGDEGAAALVEQPEGAVDLLDLEDHGADALGVLAQVTPRAPAFAGRLVNHEDRLPGLERHGALSPFALQLGAAGAELAEIELVDEEAARPLEVVHVVVQRLYLADAEGLTRRHPLNCNVDCGRREPLQSRASDLGPRTSGGNAFGEILPAGSPRPEARGALC